MKPSYIRCQPWVSKLTDRSVNELSSWMCQVEHAEVVIAKVMGSVEVWGRVWPASELPLIDPLPLALCSFDPGIFIIPDCSGPPCDPHLIGSISICHWICTGVIGVILCLSLTLKVYPRPCLLGSGSISHWRTIPGSVSTCSIAYS
jgi:hypothetical protein